MRVIDTDVQSYCNHIPRDVFQTVEKEKKAKYVTALEERLTCLTPICCSLDRVFGKKVEHNWGSLAASWDSTYIEVMGWIRAMMLFAILHTLFLCLCGSRKSAWRGL